MRTESTSGALSSNYVAKTSKDDNRESEVDPISTKHSSTFSGQKSTSLSSATGWSDESTRDPTEAMIKKWIVKLQKTIPTVDLIDISA